MENELVQLAHIYSTPGFLLLATDSQGQRLGCVGLRSLGSIAGVETAEIRRLFVRNAARNSGLGRSLINRLLADSAHAGIQRVVLNTLPTMGEAVELYRSVGFVMGDPYVDDPLEDTLYMALDIG